MTGYRVDLRSDTVTKPCEAMWRAMADAEVGDDWYGDDPTVNRLQERAAELTGHEAALYVPTGTMANQIGIRLHVSGSGHLVAAAEGAHVASTEMMTSAVLSGIAYRTGPGHEPAGLEHDGGPRARAARRPTATTTSRSSTCSRPRTRSATPAARCCRSTSCGRSARSPTRPGCRCTSTAPGSSTRPPPPASTRSSGRARPTRRCSASRRASARRSARCCAAPRRRSARAAA